MNDTQDAPREGATSVEFRGQITAIAAGEGERRGYGVTITISPLGFGLPFNLYLPFHGQPPRADEPAGLTFARDCRFKGIVRVRVELERDVEGAMRFEDMEAHYSVPPRGAAPAYVWGRASIQGARVDLCGVRPLGERTLEVLVSSPDDDADRIRMVAMSCLYDFVAFQADELAVVRDVVASARAARARTRTARGDLVAVVTTYKREGDADPAGPSPVAIEAVLPPHRGIAEWFERLEADADLTGFYATDARLSLAEPDVKLMLAAAFNFIDGSRLRSIYDLSPGSPSSLGAGIFVGVGTAFAGLDGILFNALPSLGFRSVVRRTVSRAKPFGVFCDGEVKMVTSR